MPKGSPAVSSRGWANPGLFVGGAGQIDAAGRATLSLVVPSGLPLFLDGLALHHAVIAYDATSLTASNPVTSRLFKIY